MAVCRSLWLATPCWWAIMPKPQLSRNSSGLYKPRTSLVVPTVAFTMPDDFMSELARLIKLGLDAMNAQSQKRPHSLHFWAFIYNLRNRKKRPPYL